MSEQLHRAVGNQEQDVANGKIAGYCLLCQIPYPCEYIRSPALIAENADLTAKLKLAVEALEAIDQAVVITWDIRAVVRNALKQMWRGKYESD